VRKPSIPRSFSLPVPICRPGWRALAVVLALALPAAAAAGGRFVPGARSPGLRGSGPVVSSPSRPATDARIRFGTLLGLGGARHTTLVGTGTTPIHRPIAQGGGLERPPKPLVQPIFVTVGEVVYEIRTTGDVVIVIDE
jgi:hypothetical protein